MIGWKKIEVTGNRFVHEPNVQIVPYHFNGQDFNRSVTIRAQNAYAVANALKEAADFALGHERTSHVIVITLPTT